VRFPWSPTLRNSGKGAGVLMEKLLNYGEAKTKLLSALHDQIKLNQNDIEQRLARLLVETTKNKGENSFVTLVFQRDDVELYPGDIRDMVDYFLSRVKNDDSGSKDNSAVCSICRRKESVGAKVSDVFKFATFDKPGFAYKLNPALFWVNLPLCGSCFANLAAGRSILNKDFRFSFYGCNAWVIPKLLAPSDAAISYFRGRFKKIQDFKKSFKSASAYQTLELDTMEWFEDEKNWMQLDFLYFRESNSEMKIDLYVEDVLPSHLKNVVDLKSNIEGKFSCYSCSFQSRDKPYQPLVTLGSLYYLLSGHRQKEFLEYTRSILSGNQISRTPLVRAVLDRVAKSINEGSRIREQVINAFILLEYLAQLGVIKEMQEVTGVQNVKELEPGVEVFFSQHDRFFTAQEDKAVFLLGVLAQRLLSIQQQQRGAQPFAKKFKGLNMTERDFQQLLPEIRNKFQQYRCLWPSINNLLSLTSKYLLAAGRDWKRSSDELNFCFALGLGMAFEPPFYIKKEEQEDVVNE